MTENDISYQVRGSIFSIYNELGPGLLEKVYENILAYALTKKGLKVETQVGIPVIYDGQKMDIGFRADLVVEQKVIVELKSVENLHEVHHKQLITYLRLSNLKLGLLVNFNCEDIGKNIFRKVNGL